MSELLRVGTFAPFRRAFLRFVCGIEPVAALLEQGRSSGQLSGISVLQGTGEAPPFPLNSFDAVFDYLRTGGRRYQISEGDGLFYSYSVYDSYDLLAGWADRILLIPSDPGHSRGWFHPLLTAKGVVIIAIRDQPRTP